MCWGRWGKGGWGEGYLVLSTLFFRPKIAQVLVREGFLILLSKLFRTATVPLYDIIVLSRARPV
jgi:hypothetical protein